MEKTHLITGGSGFLASALILRLHGNIRILARNEGNLVAIKQKFPQIEIITGDVADEWTVKKAMQGVTNVWHLAAMKSVDIAEEQVFSCINTNVIGTYNLLKESLITKPESFVFISTDKAAQVSGVYGATKLLDERLVMEAERMNQQTKYRTVRYGNVLYSTGSVLCKWKENMQKGEKIFITDPKMTRFFWTKSQAVELIFECLEKAQDATPYVPHMKAMSMGNLMFAMMKKYGTVEVDVIGNRGGENMHETMDGKVFSNQVEQFTIEEIMEMI